MELREAGASDLQAAAGWLGLDGPPAAWALDAEAGASFALREGSAPVGVAVLRPWGRVLVASAVVVDPRRRGRGHGRRLLDGLRETALRHDALTCGLEADPFDFESLAALLRCGFKLGAPVLGVEVPLPEDPAEEEAGAAGAEVDASPEGVPAEEAPPRAPSPAELVSLASSLDAAFDAGEWLDRSLERGRRLVGARGAGGALQACAVVEAGEGEEGGAATCPLVLVDESEPFAVLPGLLRALAGEGAREARLTVPSRQADVLRALLLAGGRPVGMRLRLCLEGFPERADLRRGLLASWR